jgi:hypothetical protein
MSWIGGEPVSGQRGGGGSPSSAAPGGAHRPKVGADERLIRRRGIELAWSEWCLGPRGSSRRRRQVGEMRCTGGVLLMATMSQDGERCGSTTLRSSLRGDAVHYCLDDVEGGGA